jgi:hypothetical protein
MLEAAEGSMSIRRIIVAGCMAIVILAIGTFLAFKFFFNSLERQIAEHWPKEDVESVTELLEKDLSARIAEMRQTANVMAFVGKDELLASLAKSLGEAKGLSNLSFEVKPGFVLAEADFAATTGEDAPDAAKGIEVTGHISAAMTALIEGDQTIQFKLLLTRISDVDIKGTTPAMLPKPVKDYLVSFVQNNLAQLNGVLNGECGVPAENQVVRVPSCLLRFPTSIPVAVDVASGLADQPQTEHVSANPVAADLKITKMAIYVGPSGLFGVSTMRLAGVPDTPQRDSAGPEPKTLMLAEIDQWFVASASERFTADGLKGRAAVAIDKPLVSDAVSYVGNMANLRLVQNFATDPQTFDTEVRLTKKPTFSCDRDSCSRQECRKPKCEIRSRDECRGDIGGLLCKAIEFTVCEPANTAENLICNTVQEVGKGSCDVFEELKKGGCEANKAFVDKALGRVGRIGGDYTVAGTYDIRVQQLGAAKDLKKLTMTANAAASARAHGSLKFTPLDQGHVLVCLAQWKEGFDVSAVIPETTLSVSAEFQEASPADDGLDLKYKMDSFTLKGKVEPSPFDAVFTQHPHLRINCSLVAGLGELARLIHIVDPENDILPDELNAAVSGDVEQEVKDTTFEIHVPDTKLELLNGTTTFRPGMSDRALYFVPR